MLRLTLLASTLAGALAGNPHLSCDFYKNAFSSTAGIAGMGLNYKTGEGCCGANGTDPLIGGALGMMYNEVATRNGASRQIVDLPDCTTLGGYDDSYAIAYASLFNADGTATTKDAACFPQHGDRQIVLGLKTFLNFADTKGVMDVAVDTAKTYMVGNAGGNVAIVDRIELPSSELYIKQWFNSLENLGGMSDGMPGFTDPTLAPGYNFALPFQALDPDQTVADLQDSATVFPGDVRITFKRISTLEEKTAFALLIGTIAGYDMANNKAYGVQLLSTTVVS